MTTGKNPSRRPIDLSKVSTHSIFRRKNLVSVANFARPLQGNSSIEDFLKSLPDVLAGRDFTALLEAIVRARKRGKPVIAALGAHVVKCGLSPLIIDLIARRVITGIAMTGAGAIHDLELALAGRTSEDVTTSLADGTYGMCRETAQAFRESLVAGEDEAQGLGKALALYIIRRKSKFLKYSILAAGAEMDVPVTVHVAIGTDIVQMHPDISPALLGEKSYHDFKTLVSQVANLKGGVWLNVGSAVVLPEVFLKALALARNLDYDATGFVTADLDMIRHYRPRVNVVERPTGRGYMITGHHEIILPLLCWGIASRLDKR